MTKKKFWLGLLFMVMVFIIGALIMLRGFWWFENIDKVTQLKIGTILLYLAGMLVGGYFFGLGAHGILIVIKKGIKK